VGNEQCNIVQRHVGFLTGQASCLVHGSGGKAEDFAPVHADVVKPLVKSFLAGRDLAPAGREYQMVSAGTVGAQRAGQNATRQLAATDHNRSGTIAKEDAGVSIVPIDDAR